jgi:hypothetical protein
MRQDALNESRGRTSRARNPNAPHISYGNSTHSQGSSGDGTAEPKSTKGALDNFFEREAEPASNKEELLALFRTVSSPSDFYMTDTNRAGVVATNWSTRIKANVDKVNQAKVLGYGKEKTRAAKTKDTRVRSIEEVNIYQMNAVETNDRSIATLIKIAKARSPPTSTAPEIK